MLNEMIRDESINIADRRLNRSFWRTISPQLHPLLERTMVSIVVEQKQYPCPNFSVNATGAVEGRGA